MTSYWAVERVFRSVALYARAIRPRVFERPAWRWWYRNGLPLSDVGGFKARFGWGDRWLPRFHQTLRQSFGVLTAEELQRAGLTREAIAAAGDRLVDREFDILGSGPRRLGRPIDWQRDFVNDVRWEQALFWKIDYTTLGQRSDVKIPWELARFHWALWLAEAWLLTRDPRYPAAFGEFVGEWLQENPMGQGIHWACPMELAIRAVNLLLAASVFADAPGLSEDFWGRLFESLFWHGRVIRGNLEYTRHLNNHYVCDGLGLLAIGLAFRDLAEGRRWMRRGKAILEEQILWQVHPDGVSYEKSISYHRLVLEAWAVGLALCRRNGLKCNKRLLARLRRMYEFTACYSRSDGTVPQLSDGDDGRVLRPDPYRDANDHRPALAVGAVLFAERTWKAVASEPVVEIAWLLGGNGLQTWEGLTAQPPADESRSFPDAGYYVMRGPRSHTILDAGPLGFAGDSVHGHQDTLSLELWAPGGVYVCDSGTYCYTSDVDLAMSFASTASHNTIVVDGEELAEWKGLWHVRHDGTKPRVLLWSVGQDMDLWEAEHYGYQRLPYGVVHRRRVQHWKHSPRWVVQDWVTGRGSHSADLRWHLHPDVAVERLAGDTVVARRRVGELVIRASSRIEFEPGWVAERYGSRRPGVTLLVQAEGDVPIVFRTEFEWRSLVDGSRLIV